MNTTSGTLPDFHFTKDNLDVYLKELGKQYRKLVGKKVPAEITIVGGAAILIHYGFRDMTNDVDAIIRAGSAMYEAADAVSELFHLPSHWLNSDFTFTKSYTDKLAYYSEPYKTFSNILHVRVISGKYLIAMKLMSGRIYKNDLSDILGILIAQREENEEITLPQIKEAAEDLYENWERIPERSRFFIESVFSDNKLTQLYQLYRDKELDAAQLLDEFEIQYHDILNNDNVNDVIGILQQRASKQK